MGRSVSLQPVPRRRVLAITALALVIVYFLWNNPLGWGIVDAVVLPLRLFVTFIHEAAHSLAALISGGRVIGFQVSPDGSGLATTAGGNRALIISAGYLGAALFGSALFYLVNRFPHHVAVLAVGLGVFMIGFSVLFARPDSAGNPLALVVGVVFGLLLLLLGMKGHRMVTLLALNVLAVMSALNAVFDVWVLVRYGDRFNQFGVRTDAVAFSQEIMPLLPPVMVSILWSVMAVLILAVSAYFALWRPLRAEVEDAYARIKG